MNGVLTGHRHSFFLDNQVVFDSLPLKPSEVVDSVVLAGPFTKDERIAALRPVEVRADILRAILAAYHEHENPLFENIHINQENLNLYEEKENSEGTAFLIVEAEDYVVVDEKAKTASLTGGLNLLLDAVRRGSRTVTPAMVNYETMSLPQTELGTEGKLFLATFQKIRESNPIFQKTVVRHSSNIMTLADRDILNKNFPYLWLSNRGVYSENRRVNVAFEEYVKYIANRRVERIGIEQQFPGAQNPFPWMSETIDIAKEKNFFETRVTEYQTSGNLEW